MGRLERAEQRLEKRYTHDVVTILRHLTGPPRSPTEGRVRRRPGCVHVQNVKRPRTASSSRQRLMWRSLNVVFAGQATSFVSAPGSRCVRSSFSMHPTEHVCPSARQSARRGRRGHWYERRRRRRLDSAADGRARPYVAEPGSHGVGTHTRIVGWAFHALVRTHI